MNRPKHITARKLGRWDTNEHSRWIRAPSICIDIGCPDFLQAARNRLMVKEKMFISGYIAIEQAIGHTKAGSKLPKWIPLGSLPEVGAGRDLTSNWGGGVE